jgi:hypothetical protein
MISSFLKFHRVKDHIFTVKIKCKDKSFFLIFNLGMKNK